MYEHLFQRKVPLITGILIKLRPHGVCFSVETHSINGMRPVAGDVVTYSYQNIAKLMVPIKPVIQRIRTDLSWEDIIGTEVQKNLGNQLNSNFFSLCTIIVFLH